MRVVFDEAETARRLVEPVESHHQSFDLATPNALSDRKRNSPRLESHFAKSSWICSSVV